MASASPLSAPLRAHLDRLLAEGTAAFGRGEIERAWRLVDRAWRLAPSNVLIARLLGRILLRAGRTEEAHAHLIALAMQGSSAELEAEIIEALLAAGAAESARNRLQQALGRYAVQPDGQLAKASDAVRMTTAEHAVGWIGIAPDFRLIGKVNDIAAPLSVELRVTGSVYRLAVEPAVDGGQFAMALADNAALNGDIEAYVDGHALIGSGLHIPRDFGLDGRAMLESGRVTGWAQLDWLPTPSFTLVVENDTTGERCDLDSAVDPLSLSRRVFAIDPATLWADATSLTISIVAPDGVQRPLPDAPLLLDIGTAKPSDAHDRAARRGAAKPFPPKVDVIVPVYAGFEETLACLGAVQATLPAHAELVVVDDRGPDARIAAVLDRLAEDGAITLLRNDVNYGFPTSVNRGMALHPDRDVVLLNSDAIVQGDWLVRLQQAAYREADIATVTPLTNAGSIASYPAGIETVCNRDEARRLDRLTAEVNAGIAAELPVGVGFCLYIRRDCLDDIGAFDAESFGRGYGEEVDFCLRATDRGWSHVLAADVFVYHGAGLSFGKQRSALLDRSHRIIRARHPDFEERIGDFNERESLAPLRRRLDEARLRDDPGSFAILVTHRLTGGVERFVKERANYWRENGVTALLLRPSEAGASAFELAYPDDTPSDLRYRVVDELDGFWGLLDDLQISAVELHHFLDLEAAVIDGLLQRDLPVDAFIHDYGWICPRLTLIDGSRQYCGEPAVATCKTCIAKYGASLHDGIGVAALRERSVAWLHRARSVTAPSDDAAQRLRRYFPDLALTVVPWEAVSDWQDTRTKPAALPVERSEPDVVRVALIGALGVNKGYELLLACARDAVARHLPLEFVVFGFTEDDDDLFATGKVFVIGRYAETEIDGLLAREAPDIVWAASLWPETWCYALTPALRANLPVLGFDLGAIGERLRNYSRGVVIPFTDDPIRLNDALLRKAQEHAGGATKRRRAALPSDNAPVPIREALWPIADPRSLVMPESPTVNALVRLLALTEGLYLFSVKSGAPDRVPRLQNLPMPAVHIGVGPESDSTAVQFLSGLRNDASWLFASGDMIIARVASSANLVMTLLQSPTGQTLDIDVVKLDGVPSVEVAPRAAKPHSNEPRATGPVRIPELPMPLPAADGRVPLEVKMHIRNQGDATFVEADWAGRAGIGRWVEAFSILPLEQVGADALEYKALTATGLETPWIANGTECGTRGKAMPLMGFAIRLRSPAQREFVCEYSGYFASGTIVGPLRNGAPCRSTLKNDPLEGMQLRLVARGTIFGEPDELSETEPRPIGPRFSKFREFDADDNFATGVNLPGRGGVDEASAKKVSKKARLLASSKRKAEITEKDSFELPEPPRPRVVRVTRPTGEAVHRDVDTSRFGTQSKNK